MSAAWFESQRFRRPWTSILLGVVAVATLGPITWGAVQQLALGRPFGNRPIGDAALAATAVGLWLLIGALIWLFLRLELRVTVGDAALEIRFVPFMRRVIRWPEIASCRARRYRPIREFGGWGIRFGRGGARAYNVSGDEGAELTLRDGRRILIGSQRAEELARAIASHLR